MTDTKKHLVVDLDSTLNNVFARLRDHAVEHGSLDGAWTPALLATDKPLPYALEAMNAFVDAGWRITVLTARPFDPTGNLTRNWLDAHGFPCPDVIVVDSRQAKLAVLLASPVQLFIDDFMGGHEFVLPRFDVQTYVQVVNAGMPVWPFRNDWFYIVKHVLGIKVAEGM